MYLKKKELLEWIEREQNNLDWLPQVRLGFLQTKKKIQSGAFDASPWETVKNPPKKDGCYLVTLKGEIAGEEKDFVGMCGFENGKWDEDGCVIAWMSFPEPARREERDVKGANPSE